MITITNKNNTISIQGLEPNATAKELMDRLSFRFSYKTKKEITFYSRKSGKLVTALVDGPVTSEKVRMFGVTDDEKLVTYEGLRHRVQEFFFDNQVPFVFNDDPDRPRPQITEDIFDGLYQDQREAAEAMLRHGGGCMLDAATSAGKTHVIAALCRAFKHSKGLIVTNRQTVASRLYDSLRELCPDNDIGIYTTQQKRAGRTPIITPASLTNYDPEEISFIIYDEAHGASGEARSRDLLSFKKAVKFGLSATIFNKFSGVHNFLEAIFGPVVYTISDELVENEGRASPLKVYILDVLNGYEPNEHTQNLTLERQGVWYNKYRNGLIKQVTDLAPEHQQLVVYVRTKYHLDHLKDRYLKDFEVYHGQLKPKEKTELLERFNNGSVKRLISTDALAEGVDPKALFITINANWQQSDVSVVQKAGRNRRLADGKAHGIVIDFNDIWTPKMESKSKTRLAKYEDRGYELIYGREPNQIEFCNTDEDISNP